MDKLSPKSCDTFVALPPATQNGCIIFGKNSDRDSTEVQEVVFIPAKDFPDGSKLMCTYIEIGQVSHTAAVVLSKPAWMWGAEMGANEFGVCIGNEAVWDKLNGPEDMEEKLLGMDLLRLGLERGKSAAEALHVITELLGEFGQGGVCSEEPGSQFTYHNSFLLADRTEAWVLETAGKYWAAEKVTEGVRNISNSLTIQTKMDLMSPNLVEEATAAKLYSESDGPFNFRKVFSDDSDIMPGGRFQSGRRLLKEHSSEGLFGPASMMKILRDEESGICMTGSHVTTSSQVSVLPPSCSPSPCCHWLTGTPNPAISFFKPFIFTPNADCGDLTQSPDYGDMDPRKIKPRFQKIVDRKHKLYASHEKLEKLIMRDDAKGHMILQNLQELESKCIEDMADIMQNFDESTAVKVNQIYFHMCSLEKNFYDSV